MSSHGSKKGYQQQDYTPEEYHPNDSPGAPSHYHYGHQQPQVAQRPVLSSYYRHHEDPRNSGTTNENRVGLQEIIKHPLNSQDRLWTRAPQASQLYSQYVSDSSSSDPFRQQPSSMTERIAEHVPSRDHSRKETEVDESDGFNSQLSQLPLDPEIVKEMVKSSTHTRRKLYVQSLEEYITDSKEALRQQGVTLPPILRSATSTGDMLSKMDDKMQNLSEVVEEREADSSSLGERDS
ncbi:16886_t:CDS:2 [Acaulospora colombiana]|uniref:16886_t:CDS:1 n=1 Tax=Acaulospora colombiana TaxID=27376 RepID=A0ACA9NZJ1_9GLOM|nr:16886_t:CDS:2 [Acaulospora colombiana]